VNGTAWIIGGTKTDGSGPPITSYQYASSQFTALPTSAAPAGLYGHAAVALSNGTILVFGGQSPSMGGIQALDTIYALDTTASPPAWSSFKTQGTTPSSRRNFAAVVLAGDKVFIQGGTGDVSVTPASILSDGFTLDASTNPMTWSAVTQVAQLGERIDHTAITQGDLVLFAFGAFCIL
jgi:N-acetylneuraminic acid mutarotase